MKNVVEFPKNKIVREAPVNVEVIEKAKEKAITSFADQIVDSMLETMLEQIENFGIDTESDNFMKDFSLTVDGLRATIYRSFDIPHHLHDFIDDNVKMIHRDTGELIEPEEKKETDLSKLLVKDEDVVDTTKL